MKFPVTRRRVRLPVGCLPLKLRCSQCHCSFSGAFSLIEEGHGFAEVQEFGLVSSGLKAVVFVEEFFGVGIHHSVWFQQTLEGVMFADDSFFVGLVFQPLQGVRFALHRQYPAGLFAGFVHTQYEKAGLCFGVGGRLEDAASPFNVAGLTLVTRNDPPQP